MKARDFSRGIYLIAKAKASSLIASNLPSWNKYESPVDRRKEIGREILEINVLHQGHLESEVTGKRRSEESREYYGLHHGNCRTSISENSSHSVLQCVK